MYYPMLRGKRFELIALRECAELFADSAYFLPVIEPVRANTLSTDLRRAADRLASERVEFGVAVNPTVGELVGSSGIELVVAELETWPEDLRQHLSPVLLAHESGNQGPALQALRVSPTLRERPQIVVCTEDFEVERLGLPAGNAQIRAIIAPRARTARRLASGAPNDVAIVESHDQFPAVARNREFLDRGELVFSDEHIYLAEEGLDGYADFATIGSSFRDGGGRPNYVAIHWTYVKPEPRADGFPIYLQHFCSTDAELDLDVGGKFHAAAGALVKAMDDQGIADTPATEVLREHLLAESFPGLGVLKKLSLVNHFHVVAQAQP